MDLPTDANGSAKPGAGDNLHFLNSCPWFLQQRFWTDSFSLQAELLKKLKKDAGSPAKKVGRRKAKKKTKSKKRREKEDSEEEQLSAEDNAIEQHPSLGNPHFDVMSPRKKAIKKTNRKKQNQSDRDQEMAVAGSSKKQKPQKMVTAEQDNGLPHSTVTGGGGGGGGDDGESKAARPSRVQSLPPKKRLRKSFEMEVDSDPNMDPVVANITHKPGGRAVSFCDDKVINGHNNTKKGDKKEGSKFLSISSLLNK